MNYWNQKQGKKNWKSDKKKTNSNWNQSLRTVSSKPKRTKKVRKSLQYLLLLKKFQNQIDYKNIKLLKAFLNKYGKIRPRRKTRISVQKQHKICRAIKKARTLKLIPFICNVKL